MLDSSGVSFRQQQYPEGVKTTKELAEYLKKKYLGALSPGKPFLLEVNTFERKRTVYGGPGVDPRYQDTTETKRFVGVLRAKPPLFWYDARTRSFVIETVRHAPISRMDGPVMKKGAIRLPLHSFRETPLDRPFTESSGSFISSSALRLRNLEVFSLAVGMEAMEKAVLPFLSGSKEFSFSCIFALRGIGCLPLSKQVQDIEQDLRKDVLMEMLKRDPTQRKSLIATAEALGFASIRKPVLIDGFSYWPDQMLVDLKRLVSGSI